LGPRSAFVPYKVEPKQLWIGGREVRGYDPGDLRARFRLLPPRERQTGRPQVRGRIRRGARPSRYHV